MAAMDHELSPELPEGSLSLLYPEGWDEILSAPDALDYQMWLEDLSSTTREALHGAAEVPSWVEDAEQLRLRWQGALELIADAAIDPEDKADMSQPEIVETALLTLQANLESLDWEEEGLRFIIPNIFTSEPVIIDLRDLPQIK